MPAAHRFFGLSIVGAVVGGILAMTAPLSSATAEPGCRCDDDGAGTGSYQCNKDQSACIAGTEACVVVCSE